MQKLTSDSWKRRGPIALAVVAIALGVALPSSAAPAAAGASCVRLDTTRDMLSADEQKAAKLLFEEALVKEGRSVDAANCAEEWVLAHIVLGRSITVTVSSPLGRHSGRVHGIEEFPAQYSQSIRALLLGRNPNDEMSGVVDRTNVTTAQTIGRRVPTENLFFVRIGYGFEGGRSDDGPMFGIGWRREMNHFALDLGLANVLVKKRSQNDSVDGGSGAAVTPVTLGVQYCFNPNASATPYVGLGVGFTGWEGFDDSDTIGFDVRLSLGYELFRASSVRAFIQADGILSVNEITHVSYPTYTYDPQNPYPNYEGKSEKYRPAVVTVSLGIGFGGGHDDD